MVTVAMAAIAWAVPHAPPADSALAHAVPVAQPIAQPAIPGVTYRLDPELGVQWHGMWAYYTDEQREAVLGQLSASNIHLVQMDVSWVMLQPNNGTTYDPWGVAFIDRVINMINAHGMTAIITFWLTPPWANGNQSDITPPTNPADYARAIGWAANRWAGKVAVWEVWNEPNSNDFFIGASPVTYTKLIQAAYPAVKRGDPNAQVMVGGLQYNDDAWLALCYAAGVKGSFDIMSTHAFQAPSNETPLTPDDGNVWRYMHLPAVRNVMVAHGDSAKSIWTGTGYSTHDNPPNSPNWYLGVTEVTQAVFINQAVNQARSNWPWVGKWFWYTTKDEENAPDFHDRHFGLFRAELSVKPGLTALTDLAGVNSPGSS